MPSFLAPNYPPPTKSTLKEEIENGGSGSFLTPNYPPPSRKSKEEMMEEEKNKKSFLTPNYPPPTHKKTTTTESVATDSNKMPSAGDVFTDEDVRMSADEKAGMDDLQALAGTTVAAVAKEEKEEAAMKPKDDDEGAASSSKAPSKYTSTSNKTDPNGPIRLTEDIGPSEIDYKLLLVASILLLFIIGISVGVGVGISRRNSNAAEDESTQPPAEVATVEDDMTSPSCPVSLQDFSTSVVIGLSTTGTGEDEEVPVNYITSVLEKTYGNVESLMMAAMPDSTSTSSMLCDPYHISIETIEVAGVSSEDANMSSEGGDMEECMSSVEITMAITGTYVACEGVAFPGLFSTSEEDMTTGDMAAATTRDGGRRQLLRGMSDRHLEGHGGGDDGDSDMMTSSYPTCPEGSTAMTPTSDFLVESMTNFLTVLPNVCALTSVKEVSM